MYAMQLASCAFTPGLIDAVTLRSIRVWWIPPYRIDRKVGSTRPVDGRPQFDAREVMSGLQLRKSSQRWLVKEMCVATFEDYSLNNLPGVRRVDGEANERNWAASNKAAGSTIDMGPGARKDTLNGFFSALNWRKTIRLGIYLPLRGFLIANMLTRKVFTCQVPQSCLRARSSPYFIQTT
jgi:hypothetical protein